MLEAQAEIRRTPINVTRQIISLPLQQGLQPPVHPSTSMPTYSSTSSFTFLTPTLPTSAMETATVELERRAPNCVEENISSYYANVNFSDEDNSYQK